MPNTRLLNMFNNPDTKPSSVDYEEKAKELFGLLTSPPLGKFPLSQSVHRFLCHGRQFFDCFEMPIRTLSESALEARNKYNRRAREFHARKTSMKDNVHDVYNYLLCTSDAYMFLTRQYTVKKGFAVFPSPAGMSLTKLSLAGNNLSINRLNNYLCQSEDFPRIY